MNTREVRILYDKLRKSAAKRKRYFTLTVEEFSDIIGRPCCYCTAEPSHILGETQYNSVDRIDNNRGYVAGNIAPACHRCNRMKFQLSHDEFIAHIKKIYEHELWKKGKTT